MLLFFFVLSLSSPSCPKFKCKPQSMNFTENTCSYSFHNNYYLQACPSDESCNFIPNQNSTCHAPNPINGWPGEYCSEDLPCAYGTCNNQKCEGKAHRKKCNTTSECDIGLHCWKKECRKLKREGHDCEEDSDCEAGLGCYIRLNHSNKCRKLFNYDEDYTIYDCNNYESKFCKSGNCIAPGGIIKGYCIDSIQSKFVVTECENKSDCLAMSGEWKFYSDCVCSMGTEGKSYCKPSLGDFYGMNYINLMKEWVESETIKSCHSERRDEESCMSKWEKYEDLIY